MKQFHMAGARTEVRPLLRAWAEWASVAGALFPQIMVTWLERAMSSMTDDSEVRVIRSASEFYDEAAENYEEAVHELLAEADYPHPRTCAYMRTHQGVHLLWQSDTATAELNVDIVPHRDEFRVRLICDAPQGHRRWATVAHLQE